MSPLCVGWEGEGRRRGGGGGRKRQARVVYGEGGCFDVTGQRTHQATDITTEGAVQQGKGRGHVS
jgi:hypothetical protein